MYKKILSLVLAVLMVASLAVVSVAAEEVTPVETKIYFQVPEDWGTVTRVYCHIWECDGEEFNSWQSKKEVCTDEGNGLWSYDPVNKGKIALEDGHLYGCIFIAKNGSSVVNQTYDALFTTECYGETLYCDGTIYENLEDSTKTCIGAFWTNMDKNLYGPIIGISSIGNVVGTCFKPGDTAETRFASFLLNKFESARKYSNKTDQAIIDDVAVGLRIESDDIVCELIKASGVADIAWIGAEGQDPYEVIPTDPTVYFFGDATLDKQINVKDATHIQKSVAKIISLTTPEILCADVNGDADVNVKDATYIQKWVAKAVVDENLGQPIDIANFIK